MKVLHLFKDCSVRGGIESVAETLSGQLNESGIQSSAEGFSFNFLPLIPVIRKADAVHLHGFRLQTPFLAILAKLFGSGVVVTPHFDFELNSFRENAVFLLNRFTPCDALTVLTEREKNFLSKKGFKKLGLIPNFVDLRRFSPEGVDRKKFRSSLGFSEKDFLVLFVGRFAANKGLGVLMDAFKEIENPSVKLAIVGREDTRFEDCTKEFLEKKVKDKGLREKIAVAGERQGKELLEAYASADLFVLPSTSTEAFGLVLLEAMAFSKPVVSTTVGGIPSFIESGVNGLLVEPRDSGALAKAIERVNSDSLLRKKLSSQGKKTSEKFSSGKIFPLYLELYASLFQKKKKLR